MSFKSEMDLLKQIKSDKQAARKNAGKGFAKNEDSTAIVTDTVLIEDSVHKESTEENPTETTDSVEESKPETPEQPVSNGLTLESVQNLLASAITPLQQQIADSTDKLTAANQKISDLEQQLDAANKAVEQKDATVKELNQTVSAINDLQKFVGKQTVTSANVNTKTSTSDSPKGLAEKLVDMINDEKLCKTNKNVFGVSPTTDPLYATQRDIRPISTYIQECFQEARESGRSWQNSPLVKDVESWFKSNGLLSGNVTDAAVTGPTINANMPSLYLDVLSSMLRETHNTSNIWWQFTSVTYDPTSAPAKNILVPRFSYIDDPTSLDDYLLADATNFNPINLILGSGSDSQSLEVTSVPVGIAQYGLGRSLNTRTRPIFIPEFHEATALLPLMNAVDTRLMQNYYKFEDLMIRLKYEASTKVLYNDNGLVTATASDIGSGDGATCTKEFLSTLYYYLFGQKIPTFPDGRYVLCLPPTPAAQLKASLDKQYAPVTPEQQAAISNSLTAVSGINIGRAVGYLGDYCGFHVFVGNTWGIGNAGDTPTVNSVTFTAGTVTCEDGFAFGMNPVGRGIALPVEVRSQGSPFGLGSAYIWVSREGVDALDVDSAISSAQQTRVFKLRFSRVAV